MNKKIITILLIGTAFFLNACQKNTDIFVPDAGQTNGLDSAWSTTIATTAPVALLQTNLLLAPAKDSFEVNANAKIINTANGLEITFPPYSCVTTAGVAITGKVYVETHLIKTKGDIIQVNKPTSSNGSLLVSGGEIFISIRKDGQLIQLAPNVKIKIRYTDVPINPLMKLFYGDESNAASFNWLQNPNSTDTLSFGLQQYEILTNHLRWINCDYFYDTTNIVRSQVSSVLPSNYTNANTAVFLVFKEMRSVLSMPGDAVEKRFISAKVPNGKLVIVVAISKQGDSYFLGKESAVVGVNVSTTNIQKVTVTPVKTSLADIKTWLATL